MDGWAFKNKAGQTGTKRYGSGIKNEVAIGPDWSRSPRVQSPGSKARRGVTHFLVGNALKYFDNKGFASLRTGQADACACRKLGVREFGGKGKGRNKGTKRRKGNRGGLEPGQSTEGRGEGRESWAAAPGLRHRSNVIFLIFMGRF